MLFSSRRYSLSTSSASSHRKPVYELIDFSSFPWMFLEYFEYSAKASGDSSTGTMSTSNLPNTILLSLMNSSGQVLSSYSITFNSSVCFFGVHSNATNSSEVAFFFRRGSEPLSLLEGAGMT